MKHTIFIDLDGVVFDTIKTITEMYNTEFSFYRGFKRIEPSEVNTWEFTELTLASPEHIDSYFNNPLFFERVELIPSAKWIINKLYDVEGYRIIFCSAGSYPNLQLKRIWVKKYFPFAEFIPVEMPTFTDKSAVKMDNSIFLDDSSVNLETCSAEVPICFGAKYPWNENYGGIRCETWAEVYEFIKNEEKKRHESKV